MTNVTANQVHNKCQTTSTFATPDIVEVLNCYQRKLANGKWVDLEDGDIDWYVDTALEIEPRNAKAQDRNARNKSEMFEYLAKGSELEYGDDWYMRLRIKPEGKQRPRMNKPDAEQICSQCKQTELSGARFNTVIGICDDCV